MSDARAAPAPGRPIRLLIVDDSASYRRELVQLLVSSKRIEVVGEAEDGWEAIQLAEQLRPEVVLMDQNMPSLSGIDATRRIKARRPQTRVIFVAAEGQWREEAMRAGAEGYLLKEDDGRGLLDAIRDPLAGLKRLAEAAPPKRGSIWEHPWLWRGVGSALVLSLLVAMIAAPSVALPATALILGFLFFCYGLKYYLSVSLILFATNGVNGNGNGRKDGHLNHRRNGVFNGRGNGNGNNGINGLVMVNDAKKRLTRKPFVSIHLPLYNEKEVVDRLLTTCTSLDYPNYEVVVADDSTDETTEILRERWGSHPRVKISHRKDRTAFKGGALQNALRVMDPRTEFIVVFDADFLPPPDILYQFLAYYYGLNGHNNGPGNGEMSLVDDRLAVVQGYQWHVLNASENWITRGIRTEFSGSYVVERSVQEYFGAMKMISGSVYMIRADVLRKFGWGASITEDWELTLRLYLGGYKVLYTPFIQAPAECVADFKQLARQRMRWSEGHTFNVKNYFLPVLLSPNLTLREKLEFIYYAPYYLQSAFFILGTGCWFLSELVLRQALPFWTSTLGWSLVFSNLLSLGLMNLAGLFLERGVRHSWKGLLSFVLLSYLLVPYQAYAAIKGLIEPHEGGWHRTKKTGVITEKIGKLWFRKKWGRLKPGRRKTGKRPVDLGERLGVGSVAESTGSRPLAVALKRAAPLWMMRWIERLGPVLGSAAERVVAFLGALHAGPEPGAPRPSAQGRRRRSGRRQLSGFSLSPALVMVASIVLALATLGVLSTHGLAAAGGDASRHFNYTEQEIPQVGSWALPSFLVIVPLLLVLIITLFSRRHRSLATTLIILVAMIVSQLFFQSATVEAFVDRDSTIPQTSYTTPLMGDPASAQERPRYGPADESGYRERLDLRQRTSKTEQLFTDGQPTDKFSYDGFVAPVHYQDAYGDFQEISTALLPSQRFIPGFGSVGSEMTKNEYEMYIAGEAVAAAPLVRYVRKNTDAYVQFGPHGLRWTNDFGQAEAIALPARVTTVVSENEARWPNFFGEGMTLRYVASGVGLHKLLELQEPLAPPPEVLAGGDPALEFVETFSYHPDLSLWVDGVRWDGQSEITGSSVEFRAPSGEAVFGFPTPFASDANGDQIFGQLRLWKEGGSLLVSVHFPAAWLQSAVYPVTLDPTIDLQVGTSTDDAYEKESNGAIYRTDKCIKNDSYGTVTYRYWGGYRFTGTLPAQGSTINVAYMTIYIPSGSAGCATAPNDDPNLNIHAQSAAAPATFPATYYDITSRTRTTASASWVQDNIGMPGYKNSPSIVSVVQEIVDNYNPTAMVFIFRPNTDAWKMLSAYDYTGNAAGAAQLHIEYTGPPNPPSNCQATYVSDTQINVSWTDNSSDETGFKIERSADGAAYSQIGTDTASPYSDTTTSADHSYQYKVRAYNAVGNSAYCTATSTIYTSPDPPTSVSADHTADLQITVSWTDQSLYEDQFRIERDKNGGGYVFLANDAASPYVDSTITQAEFDNKDTFTYRVRAEISSQSRVSSFVTSNGVTVPESVLLLALVAPFFPRLIRVSSKRANARPRTKGRRVRRKG